MNIEMTAEQIADLGKIWGNAYLSSLPVDERFIVPTLSVNAISSPSLSVERTIPLTSLSETHSLALPFLRKSA